MAEDRPHLFRASRPNPLPEVGAALRAGEKKEGAARWRRLAGGLLLLVLIAAAVYGLQVWLRPGYVDHLRAERGGWKNVQFIAPGEERIDPATGEATLPYDGFGIYADSEPDGARVSAGGRVLGETPVAAAVPCSVGDLVTLRFERAGHRPQEVTTRCRQNAMVKVRVALRR